MLAVVSRLFFYKDIARLLLQNFGDNLHEYKANFLWWFHTNLIVFIVLMKKCLDDIQREERADRKKTHEERNENIFYIFL